MNSTIAVAISGGVDSLVAAYILKEQGKHIIGIHFLTGFETTSDHPDPNQSQISDRIHEIGSQLEIPVKLFDCRIEFKKQVVDYFTQTYLAGQTPNPCMVCNPTIKFGTLLSYANEQGAEQLATGHYARIKEDGSGIFRLFKGIDPQKDQSYFLARLSQQQLAGVRFPLGGMTKSAVKRLAKQNGLHPITTGESQDVCFIKGNNYGEFLSQQQGFRPEPGIIEDIQGNILGKHDGLHLFTIGQRRGINCPASQPYYVIRLDKLRNRLMVGLKKDLLSTECNVIDINYIHDPLTSPTDVLIRVRYRHKEVKAMLTPIDPRKAKVRFESPQEAVTPGQGAVFYRGDEILGGGWISFDE